MKVTISCIGKFHAFHLAEQLGKRGYLHKLITTFYSKKKGCLLELRRDIEQIDEDKVVTNIIPAFIGSGLCRIPWFGHIDNWHYYACEIFDKWAASKITGSDIVVAWADTAQKTLRVAKRYGAITIVERGSSHISFQKEILDEEYQEYGAKFKPVDERIVQKELAEYSEADYISIPSKFAKKTYIKYGIDPKKLIQVPYGVDLSRFKPILKEDQIFRVIFVGTLSLRKGVHYLLRAFSELKLKNAELILAGTISPEVRKFLREYEGSYKYLGMVPNLDLYKHLSQSSVFVLPSIEEGLALTIFQAMACGLPLICSTNTGALDVVRDGIDGYIIPIRDVDAIKEKLIFFYENPDICKKLGNSALNRVKNGFSWDDYGDKITTEYLRILKRIV